MSFNQPEGGDGEPTLYIPSSQPLSKCCAWGKAAGPDSPPHLPQVLSIFQPGPQKQLKGAGTQGHLPKPTAPATALPEGLPCGKMEAAGTEERRWRLQRPSEPGVVEEGRSPSCHLVPVHYQSPSEGAPRPAGCERAQPVQTGSGHRRGSV